MPAPATDPAARKGINAPALAAFVSDAATEQTIKALVEEQVTNAPVIRRGTIAQAVRYLESALAPAVLIVDVSGLALPLSEIDRLMKACDPSVVVIVIGESPDIALFRSLLQFGVNDYLVKPVTVELLRRTIARFNQGGQQSLQQNRTGKILTVTGTRGGAGASTVLVNLAWTLANRVGRKVAVIDLDPHFGAVNLMIGAPKSSSLAEAIKYAHRLDGLLLDRILVPHGDKLSLLSAEEPLEEDLALPFERLALVCQALQQQFHYVMIDLPRRPGTFYSQVLGLSQVLVLVATPTVTALRDLLRIQRISGREGLGRRALLLLNHVCPHTSGELAPAEFEEGAGRNIDYHIPYASGAVLADNQGVAAVSESSALAKVFRDIGDDLSGRTRQQGRHRSLLARWLKP